MTFSFYHEISCSPKISWNPITTTRSFRFQDLDFDFHNLESNPHPPESLVGGDTPLSSLSPSSSSCLQSPASYSAPSPMAMFLQQQQQVQQLLLVGGRPQQQLAQQPPPPPPPGGDQGSPTGTTQDMQEFLQASLKCERDLSNLTLSDQEQRELYEAAQIIQKAYRSYKGRRRRKGGLLAGTQGAGGANRSAPSDHQAREAKAAVVIQNYYRRYKQVR